MARPTDWSPLAGSDPVPGDPGGISAEATHLSKVAEHIAGQVAVLRKIAASHSVEKGLHAGKLQEAASDTAGKLAQVTGRYKRTAAALAAWVPELEHAQAQSLRALHQAQDAHARQTANASHPQMRPAGTKPTPAEQHADHARAHRLQQANSDLSAAHAMLNRAVSHRDQKAGETARKINDAIGADSDSAWDSFKHWVDQHADVIKTIADWATKIATVCGILSMFLGWVPILGWVLDALTVLATAVALVSHLMLALAGDGSWLDVGMDVIALATFGVGRAFSSTAEEGFTAARAAARSPVARMLGKSGQGLARSEVTSEAERLTGMTAKDAAGTVQEAKAGLKVPSWGRAVLHGVNPVNWAKDFVGVVKEGISGGGERAFQNMTKAAHDMNLHSPAGREIAKMPSVTRFTHIAEGAAARAHLVSIGDRVNVVHASFDQVSGTLNEHHTDVPVFHQWSEAKDWATHGV